MKKNGFTLIELLATIIILSVIATITLPIISDVLSSTKEGIANDSAYGYKRAVDEYFYHKNINKEEIKLNGVYKVSSDGSLYNDNETHQITVDGKAPQDGILLYNNSELISGCLTINKYKVTFENGLVTTIEKGSCNLN